MVIFGNVITLIYKRFPWFGFFIYKGNKWLAYANCFGIHFCLIEATNFLHLQIALVYLFIFIFIFII
jgi:hypothetical protein